MIDSLLGTFCGFLLNKNGHKKTSSTLYTFSEVLLLISTQALERLRWFHLFFITRESYHTISGRVGED